MQVEVEVGGHVLVGRIVGQEMLIGTAWGGPMTSSTADFPNNAPGRDCRHTCNQSRPTHQFVSLQMLTA